MTKIAKKVFIFTDGACRGNPGPGGWGALLRYGAQEKILYGAEAMTTNNRMELLATIKALQALKRSCDIELTTDSQYVRNGITEWIETWKKNSDSAGNWGRGKKGKNTVKNLDLWQLLDQEAQRHHITWHWVRGHSGHVENEIADALANRAIDELLKRHD
ncbi:MAG: ribonuclease HI [Gammaproteobacteria bacterium]